MLLASREAHSGINWTGVHSPYCWPSQPTRWIRRRPIVSPVHLDPKAHRIQQTPANHGISAWPCPCQSSIENEATRTSKTQFLRFGPGGCTSAHQAHVKWLLEGSCGANFLWIPEHTQRRVRILGRRWLSGRSIFLLTGRRPSSSWSGCL